MPATPLLQSCPSAARRIHYFTLAARMPDDLKSFVGASLQSVEEKDYSWFFTFDAPLLIASESP
jgi:hypothetical protein